MSHEARQEDASDDDVFVCCGENTDDMPSPFIPIDIDSLRIDSSVKRIPPDTFQRYSSLTTVEYQEGLEFIGDRAFNSCSSLRKSQFPSTLVEIGTHAFSNCMQLESVAQLPASLKMIRAFAFRCTKLQSIEITNGTIHLEEGVFSDCRNLRSCRLPDGMVTIPNSLFFDCCRLIDVNVPSSVVEIEDRAFCGCENLATIELSAGLKTIGAQSLSRTGLRHFRCPVTVESIGVAAFSSCFLLESVILSPKLVAISDWTFENCFTLKDVSIPQSVVRIGARAFAMCKDLRNLAFPRSSGLERIDEMSFEGCRSLTHFWAPATVEYMDNGVFAGCTRLLSIEVPENLKRLIFLGESPYRGSLLEYTYLVNIILPPLHKLDGVGECNFMRCLRLSKAEFNDADLVDKLKHRFDLLPLHRICYFQSYHSLQENINSIHHVIGADGPIACERVDFLGMTPFHILSLSLRPCRDLFQELISVSSSSLDIIMKYRDIFEATPWDYLLKNHRSAVAVDVIKSLLPIILGPRISFLGLSSWREGVQLGLDELQPAEDEESLHSQVTSIYQKLAELELMEVLSLLEMSVWRKKMKEEQATGNDAIREGCRINCGSRIVLDHVMSFLGDNT